MDFDVITTTTKTLKWYRIEGYKFIESPHQLPASYTISPIVWTPTPFRVILGDYPIRVWQLDPITLEATLLSEYLDPDAIGRYASLVADLQFLYLNGGYYDLRRVRYFDATGSINGPVCFFETPYRGQFDMTSTSDGRWIVALDNSSIMIHRIDDEGVPHTTSYYEPFGMRNLYRARFTPDDRYLLIIALDDNNVNSFTVNPDGTLTPITQLTGFVLAQAMGITPDGKFMVVAHHYYGGQPAAILSVFRINEDGTLSYLSDKDVPLPATVGEVKFFPPQRWPTAAHHWTQYY
ncbi:hypothetical protein J7M23_05875 [Candidatus Sumerlaeota bacterium]|nr:hypothetical protein [Candidatus Sumerlaeota bacterium]